MPDFQLDHVTIAVRNLDSSTHWFSDQLGFSIKPGRLHSNSINNSHVKVENATALELITAKDSIDETARGYIDLLEIDNGVHFIKGTADRPIQGITVAVRNIESSKSVLGQRVRSGISAGSDSQGQYIRVPPNLACGVWLDFLELEIK